MSDDLTPIEEQTLDAFLTEALADSGPPDLAPGIFAQLQADPPSNSSNRSLVRTTEGSKRSARSSPVHRPVAVVVTVIAGLAATVLLAIWLRPDRLQPSPPSIAGNDAALPDSPAVTDRLKPQADVQQKIADASSSRKPPRGIPMVIESTADSEHRDLPQDAVEPKSPASPAPLEAVALVSAQVDSELHSYWNAIGIQPAGDAGAGETAARLSDVLGIELSADAMDDPQRLAVEMAQPAVARAIALRWLKQMTERGLLRLDQQARDGLIEDLAACFRSQREFDRTLAGWIDGQSSNSSAFYAALSSGPKRGDRGAMARRLASLTMNADLRCTRCHDAYIEGNGRQQDYWGFAAFLRQGVAIGPGRDVTIDPSLKSGKPVFYELPDGRQRIAQPAVAASWMKSQEQPIRRVQDWSRQLIGSPELARGVVNSLWQLVHRQPLRGRVVDPISAPHNDALDQLEEHLAGDLIRSRFDVARTLSLIIASPATRCGVPKPLLPENALVADESEIRAAMSAVDAFAATLPPRVERPMGERVDEAMRAIGAKLDSKGRPFLAQPGAANKPGNAKVDPKALSAKPLSADFPGRASELPVQWLSQIEDQQSQVAHLGYLVGISQVPTSVLQAADSMRNADVPAELLLHRVWWLLQP